MSQPVALAVLILGIAVPLRAGDHKPKSPNPEELARAGRFLLIAATYGAAVLLPGPKSSSAMVEATVNVSEAGEEARLRVSFQVKILDGGSRVKEVRSVDDPRFYQDFFAKVDKELFLVREKLS